MFPLHKLCMWSIVRSCALCTMERMRRDAGVPTLHGSPMKRNKMFLNYLDNTEKWAVPQKSTERVIILEDSIRRKKEKGLSVKPRHSFRYYHRPVYRLSIWNVDPGRQLDTDTLIKFIIIIIITAFTQEEFHCYPQIKNLRDCLDVASYWSSTCGICQPTRTMSAFSDVGFTVMDICYLVVWNWSKWQLVGALDMVTTPENHNTWGCWTVLPASLGWVCRASAEPQQFCVARTGDKNKVTVKSKSSWKVYLHGVYHVFEYGLTCSTTAIELPYRHCQHCSNRGVGNILTAAWDRCWCLLDVLQQAKITVEMKNNSGSI